MFADSYTLHITSSFTELQLASTEKKIEDKHCRSISTFMDI